MWGQVSVGEAELQRGSADVRDAVTTMRDENLSVSAGVFLFYVNTNEYRPYR